jgi:hypothetical protein
MGWFDVNADKPSAIIKKPEMTDEVRTIYNDAMQKSKADQSKPWDFRIESERAIPDVIKDGHGSFERNCWLIDFKMLWHTNDNRGEVNTKWQALYADQSSGQPEIIFVKAFGSNADVSNVPSTIETCEQAEQWLNGEESKSKLTMSLNIDCSEALKGLKAIQREARATARELKELSKSRVGIDLSHEEPEFTVSDTSELVSKHPDEPLRPAIESVRLPVGKYFEAHDVYDRHTIARIKPVLDDHGDIVFRMQLIKR